MKPALAAAVLLLAATARAASGDDAFAAASGVRFETAYLRAMPQQPPQNASYEAGLGALGKADETIHLAHLLDNGRRASTTFKAGNTVVHVFGTKSQNKKEWFVGFAPEGEDAQFRKGKKMLHWVFINRTVHLEIAGRAYSAWVEGKATDRLHSKLIVEPDGGGARAEWTVDDLSASAYAAGAPVKVGGREFRLLYSRDFVEDGKGDFGGYSGDRSIVLMYKDGSSYSGFHWFEREIPSDKILVATPRSAKADDSYAAGSFSLGLRLANGVLELYSK